MKESAKISVVCLWLLIAHLLPLAESSPGTIGGCQSRESASPIIRNVSDSVQLHCLDNSPCQGTSYAFYHNNLHTGQFELVHQGSYKLTIHINTLDTAGEYYCIKECSRDATPADQHKCYWNVIVSPVLRWNVTEKVIMNQSTNGSCTATGSTRPLIKVILASRCEYRTELTVIDNYTTAVEFRISHVSRYCQDIYCYISNHRTPNFSKQLNITEVPERINVSTTDDADSDSNSGNLPAESGAKCATMEAYVLLVTLALVLVSSV